MHVPAKLAVRLFIIELPVNSDFSPSGLATRAVCTLGKLVLLGMVARIVALQRTALRSVTVMILTSRDTKSMDTLWRRAQCGNGWP